VRYRPSPSPGSPQFRRVRTGKNLASFDHVSFVNQDLGNAAGRFGRDVNFFGFDPAIPEGDVVGRLALLLLPPVVAADGNAHSENDHDQDGSNTLHDSLLGALPGCEPENPPPGISRRSSDTYRKRLLTEFS
jgi:hypothetical protein